MKLAAQFRSSFLRFCFLSAVASLVYAALPDTISITCGHIITILPDVVVCSVPMISL